MDITAIFKSCLETLRQTNKELSCISPLDKSNSSNSSSRTVKPKIFPGKKSENFSKARELSATITSLRDYLYDNRNAYLNIAASQAHSSNSSSVFTVPPGSGKKPRTPTMSDMDRDLLDNDVQKIIHNCQKKILEYESLIEMTDTIKNNVHVRTHLESISESLTAYLKQVTTVFSEMRAVRVKRTVDYQNMSRLSSLGSANKGTDSFINRSSHKESELHVSNHRSKKQNSLGSQTVEEIDGVKSPTIPDYFLDDGDIPPEELQLLEEENAALLNELNSLAQEVDQIQSNVVQIAQLQEIFTEKVLQQEKEIDTIGSVVVGATENIKGGNEQIRQAIQKNADFRVWVLFFILVMSFSLLFLDWYNE
ncbi:syntaxin-18 [Folsomia candida]|uniref:Syntaxin-18 n=1 Tax=Folsomia candida TaxID=158441 RepID=A0A226F5G8_FOLCA|nr:syntaxin-18 [Folsomia candida]OXA65043.1 Syntaxin-18 [Folsomia candida]